MSDILILKSIDGHPLTEQFMKKCLDENEMFIVKKIFSPDRSSVELTFVDDESTTKTLSSSILIGSLL